MFEKISKNRTLATYKVGDLVKENGCYICVPCGYKKYLTIGMNFPDCLKCMGKRWFKKGLETWEKVYED